MNTLKKAWYAMLVMIVAGIGFVSCDKSMDEPLTSENPKEVQNKDALRATQTRAISDWVGKDLRESNGSFVDGLFLYKKDSEKTYVLKVNLSKRQIRAYFESSGRNNETGAPMFNLSRASSYNLSNYGWYALINASFFWLGYNPTPLSFYLRKDGKTIAAGTGSYAPESSQDGYRKYFSIHNGKAYIGSAQWTTTLSGSAPSSEEEMKKDMEKRLPKHRDIFCGLDPVLNNKGFKDPKGRTMVGINSASPNIVYILVATSLSQEKANDYLVQDFGCDEVVMFDGSASSQFNFLDTDKLRWKVDLKRPVPVFFAIK